jgi:tetratricopeptide (TPR) repeat protein
MMRAAKSWGIHVVTVLLTAQLGACATGVSTKKVAPPPPPKAELDTHVLCQTEAAIDDATARGRLADLRAKYEANAEGDRQAAFGAMLAIATERDRFKAFHDDATDHPDSAVSPLGECMVYARWKMPDQAVSPCAVAAERLKGAAILDVAGAELLLNQGKLVDAEARAQKALTSDATCTPAYTMLARIKLAAKDNTGALDAYAKGLTSSPDCFVCAVESAKLTERTAGKAASVPLWEKALAIAPDHIDTLKRYGAVQAGLNDDAALAAYEKAIQAGVVDVATLKAAAELAKGKDIDRALGYAGRVVTLQANDVDAWRLVLALATQKPDPERMKRAATEVLRLVNDDLPAHLVLLHEALASLHVPEALAHDDVVHALVVAGKTAPLTDAQVATAKSEHADLMQKLHVLDKPPTGKPEAVLASVQKTVQKLFAERVKDQKGKRGELSIVVRTDAQGVVDSVELPSDTLGDPWVAASVVANLKHATLTGGARRYTFSMEFQ